MSEQTEQLVESIRRRLQDTRKKITSAAATSGFFVAFTAGMLLWLLAILIETGMWLAPVYRTIIIFVVSATVATMLFRNCLLPVLNHFGIWGEFSEISLASEIGRSFPSVRDRLVNLLQLVDGNHSGSTDEWIDAAANELGQQVESVPFEQMASFASTFKYARVASVPLAALLILLLAGPIGFRDASRRLSSPLQAFHRPAPFSLLVFPGAADVIRGDSLVVSAVTSGIEPPGALDVEFRYSSEERSQLVEMAKDGVDEFSSTFSNIRQSFEYRAIRDDVSSDWFGVTVLERPIVQQLQLSLNFPRYTRIPDRQLPPDIGDVSAIKGTQVRVEMNIGGALADSTVLVFASGGVVPVPMDGSTANGKFTVAHDDHYRIKLRSVDGIGNRAPIDYAVESLLDEMPAISIVSPDPKTDLTESATIDIRYRITDDFGFSSLRLYFRRAESRFGEVQESFSSLQIPLDRSRVLDREDTITWILNAEARLDPVPGDVIEYYLTVRDNDTISGPKESSSSVYLLRLPSLADQYEAVDTAEDTATDKLESILDEAKSVQDVFDELQKNLREKPEPEWQDKRKLEQLKNEQTQLEHSVDDLGKHVEELADELENNDLVTPETLDLFEQLEEVIEDVNSPDLMEALDTLQESMEQMDLGEMNRAMEEFEFDEKMYQERLQRTLDIFKQVQVQKDLDEATRRIEDLERIEASLGEKTEDLKNNPDKPDNRQNPEKADGDNKQNLTDENKLARQQQQASEDMKGLEEKLEEIRERMEDVKRAPAEKMQDIAEDTEDMEIPRQMSENAEQIQERKFDNAQKGQQQIQRQLGQVKSQLSQMQQNMQGQQLQINTAGLRSILEDILTLSVDQEALRLKTSLQTAESPALRSLAQDQVDLSEGLTVVADSLQRMAREIPQMGREVQKYTGKSLKSMEEATAALADRVVRKAAGHQMASMTFLNELAVVLSELLNQMMSGQGSGSGNMSMQQLMDQLQNLGQQQQQLNDQIQQLLNDAQGNRLTQDMTERLRQMGGQQEQIRRQIKQLSRDRTARNKLMGDLNRIAEQMLESIQDLQENRVSRRTVQRQQQILTRMLEATKSLQERGKDKKRKSETGTDLVRPGPGALSPTERLDLLRRDLFKALESGYSPDYERLIRQYFDLLQQKSTSGN